ncbi:MAG: type II secretion system F family protein [Oscillospiraceae bacterium]|jgi:tight adherence protein C|nr:type II secretion system F family protein [Oscillospiraceae bacterium]
MKIALIAVLALSTILLVIWFLLLFTITDDDRGNAAINKVLANRQKIAELRRKDALKRKKLAAYHGLEATLMNLLNGGNSDKEIAKLEKKNAELQEGETGKAGILELPGYVILRTFDGLRYIGMYKTLLIRHIELYGRKYADNRTRGLIAAMFSYAILGVAVALPVGTILLAANNAQMGMAFMVIGSAIVLLLAYSLYDKPRADSVKRKDAITRQFPNVVSKLALLVTSGMIMDKAWRQTAEGEEGALYGEMRAVSDELENLISPEAAYSSFINRCNTKETSKLASAIMQNLKKGNDEIGNLLKELAHESWQERRHIAKRDAEKANSQLMIPTMLLFVMLLVMIMVPIFLGFSAGGI